MNEIHNDRQAVYEIGYLFVGSLPEERVPAENDKVRKIIADAGASVIAEEVPHRERLAYTIRRKTVAGSYEKYDEAYFGWIKFEVGTVKIEGIKKSLETLPVILRMLVITTVRENTYLGKRAPALASVIRPGIQTPEKTLENAAAPVAPVVNIEEMDKSIDEMVKEV
ncbi:MAG: 30S ribosomal protein S6 [Patescibacteria group bacterium]|nr:30S ribosomal protein S6 [Patescibacteria group bacterium]MDE2172525.1 30S ribosomal protein S6 [Patescibacteria group bacterium]